MKTKKRLALVLACLMFVAVCPLAANPSEAVATTYEVSSAYRSSTFYSRLMNVQLTGDYRTDIINIALSQEGYHEGNSVSDLNGMNQNGSNNFTEYGYWWGTQVNGNSYGSYYAWCAYFVSWCARQARIPTSILNNAAYAKADGVGGGGSNFHITYYPASSHTPQAGDLFFTGSWDHVGIVVSVDDTYIHTIEGNTNNDNSNNGFGAYRRDRLRSSISYYGTPNYDGAGLPTDPTDPSLYPIPTRDLYNGCSGDDVKWLQAALTELGYTLEIDGQFGSLTMSAVSSFQTDNGVETDANGYAGEETRMKIQSRLESQSGGRVELWRITSSNGVNLRSGPGTSFSIVGAIPYGHEITVTEKTMADGYTWGKTSYGASDGWAVLDYAELVSATYSVVFEDWDGTVLSTQRIVSGGSATPPANPVRTGYTFIGWDCDFSNVTANITVKAQYTQNTLTEDSPLFCVESATGRPGDTVQVAINAVDNPGMVAIRFGISWDAEILELESAVNGTVMSGNTVSFTSSENTSTNPYIVAWVSTSNADIEEDGELLLLTFKIKSSAPEGTSSTISIGNIEVLDVYAQSVEFLGSEGRVEVIRTLSGDLNDNGIVDMVDGLLALRYIAGWQITINERAGDVNNDGEVSVVDALMILRYLAGWDIPQITG